MKRLEARVFGTVQGIGFRGFVKRKAESFFLKGFVQNMADSSVRIVAEGPEPNLQQLLRAISKSPFFERIKTIETKFEKAGGLFVGFDVR